MDIETAKQLHHGEWLHHKTETQGGNGQKTCFRIRVNGKPQTWKTRPDQIRVPVRWGMRPRDQFDLWQLDIVNYERERECSNPAHS
jgi:hypothetical protein